MNKAGSGLLALALLGVGAEACALGLGEIEVKSGFNQPLVAELPILVERPEELDSLRVALAPPDAFARVGLDRPRGITANLRFNIIRDEDGGGRVRITSPTPVRDPYLIFLIDAQWEGGRLVREYSVLIDPPLVAPAIHTSVAPAVVQRPGEARPVPAPSPSQPVPATREPSDLTVVPVPEDRPAPAEPLANDGRTATERPAEPASDTAATEPAVAEPARTVSPPPVAPPPTAPPPTAPAVRTTTPTSAAGTSQTVARGETLWSVAQRSRSQGITVNQMMIALLNANRRAFIDDNINYLKAGEILRIPDAAEAAALSAAEADALVAAQNALWLQGRGSAPVRPEPVLAGADPAPSGNTDATATAPSAAAGARLQIVASDPEAEAVAAQSGIDSEGGGTTLARSEDAAETGLISSEARQQALQERLERLEKIRADSERLLSLREQELATLQTRVAELERSGGVSNQPWYNRPWAFAAAVVLVAGLIAVLLILRRDQRGLRRPLEPNNGARRKDEPAAAGKTVPTRSGEPEPAVHLAPAATPSAVTEARGSIPRPAPRPHSATGSTGTGQRAEFGQADQTSEPVASPAKPATPSESPVAAPVGTTKTAPPPSFAIDSDRSEPAAPEWRHAPDPKSPVRLDPSGDDTWDTVEAMLPGPVHDRDDDDPIGLANDVDADADAGSETGDDSRLDLAQALIYMGDKDGARALLEDIVAGDDPELARRAREKLDAIR